MPDKPWGGHNEQARKQSLPPSATLLHALDYLDRTGVVGAGVGSGGVGATDVVGAGGIAADLGCGPGIDTFELLARGWSVLAIDKDQRSIESLQLQLSSPLLTVRVQNFESLRLPSIDLANASFALPFCQPRYFQRCWNTIRQAIRGHGVFCGHFFGVHDSWSDRPTMSFHRKEDISGLFAGFEILLLDESEKDGPTITGLTKHWHVFSVVARKSTALTGVR
jgi:SAM-dependent methyltransferase